MSTSSDATEPRTQLGVVARPRTELPPPLFRHAIDYNVPSQIWGCSPALGDPRLARGVALRCYRAVDGTRLFLPGWDGDDLEKRKLKKRELEERKRAGWERFVQTAGALGVGLIERNRGEPTSESRAEADQHAVMLTLREYACRTREFRSRHFGAGRISSCGSAGVGGAHRAYSRRGWEWCRAARRVGRSIA